MPGLKPKDLVGIPWRVAFALQADGWWLRSDIVWSKPNPMPESVTDRPTRAHEYVFLLTKSARYYYDAEAIRTEPVADSHSTQRWERSLDGQKSSPTDERNGIRQRFPDGWARGDEPHDNVPFSRRERRDKQRGHSRRHDGFNDRWDALSKEQQQSGGANARTVWQISTEPYPEAHFATFPTELARRCILAGSRPGDLVLDPFAGSGTTLLVADTLGRPSIGIEINPAYVTLAHRRLTAPRSEPEATRRHQESQGQTTLFEDGTQA